MAEKIVWLQGAPDTKEVKGGWASNWGNMVFDYKINLSTLIPKGAIVTKVNLDTEVDISLFYPNAYMRPELLDTNKKVLFQQYEVLIERPVWKNYPCTGFDENALKFLTSHEQDYYIRFNFKGTDRYWRLRNSKLVIDYESPLPIYVGDKNVKQIYVGQQLVKQIYVGSTLIE